MEKRYRLVVNEDNTMEFKKVEKRTKQHLLAKLRLSYYDYFPQSAYLSFRDFAQETGLYSWLRLHPELIDMDLSGGDLVRILNCEYGRRRGY